MNNPITWVTIGFAICFCAIVVIGTWRYRKEARRQKYIRMATYQARHSAMPPVPPDVVKPRKR